MVLGAFNSLRIQNSNDLAKLPLFPFNGSFVIFPKIHKNVFPLEARMNSIESKDNGETNVCVYGAMGKTTIDVKQ
jgi:hypothetical protein